MSKSGDFRKAFAKQQEEALQRYNTIIENCVFYCNRFTFNDKDGGGPEKYYIARNRIGEQIWNCIELTPENVTKLVNKQDCELVQVNFQSTQSHSVIVRNGE